MQQANEITLRLFIRKLASKNLDHEISGFEANQGNGQDVIYGTGRIYRIFIIDRHVCYQRNMGLPLRRSKPAQEWCS